MTEQNDAQTRATAQDLTAALNVLAAEVKRLRTYGRKNRAWIVFDVLLTVALGISSFIAVHASVSAHDAQEAAVAARAAAVVAEQDNRNLCLSSNVARSQQIELWTFVIGLGKGKPQTAQQKENIEAFRHELALIDGPRDCSHVSPGNPGPVPAPSGR